MIPTQTAGTEVHNRNIGSIGPKADLLLIVAFALLPVVGLSAGPSYAGLVFGLGAIRLVTLLWGRRMAFRPDLLLTLLAGAYATLAGLGSVWSIVPTRTLAGSAQMAGILGGALVFLGTSAHLPDRTVRRLATALTVAFVCGAVLMAIERTFDYPLHRWMHVVEPDTKYNRGIIHSLILFWPVISYQASARCWPAVVALAVAMVVTVGAGISATAQMAAGAATVTMAAAYWAPRLTERVLAGAITVLAAALPVGLRLLSGVRNDLVPYLKNSAMHRLEIWDYMSARVTERPLLGWGMWSATALPVSHEEVSHYLWADGVGIYPHNQWLQLWVETGMVGAALGLAFALAILFRIRRLSATTRPFAYAAFAAALTVSCADFQLTTDSWWAVLAATAFLFGRLDSLSTRQPPVSDGGSTQLQPCPNGHSGL